MKTKTKPNYSEPIVGQQESTKPRSRVQFLFILAGFAALSYPYFKAYEVGQVLIVVLATVLYSACVGLIVNERWREYWVIFYIAGLFIGMVVLSKVFEMPHLVRVYIFSYLVGLILAPLRKH